MTNILSVLILTRLAWTLFAMPQQSTIFTGPIRRNLYTNLTCPLNCTCSSYQPQSKIFQSGPSRPTEKISQSGGPLENAQWETLAPKKVVDCDQITLENIRDIFAYLPEGITSFSLRRSGLTSLVDICCLEDLEMLDLSYNRISDLIVYVEFEKLTFLNLQGNSLRILRKDEFISFPNVEILNVDSNDVELVDQESFRLMKLQQLYLSGNKISYVNERAFRYAANLELLNLSANRLSSVHARNFYFSRKLRSLDLSQNHLTHIDDDGFDPLSRLEELNLSWNNLSLVPTLALHKLNSLKTLTLDGNPLRILENGSFWSIPSLESLRLDQLFELTMILDGAFQAMPKLRRVSICGCRRLQYISKSSFDGLENLKEIYLTNNALIFVPASILRLGKVDFSGNPINCECMRSIDPKCDKKENRVCDPILVPTMNSNFTRPIGASISLYCMVIDGNEDDQETEYEPVWTLPSGKLISPGQRVHRFEADHQRLAIDFLLQDDDGRYTCALGKVRNGSVSVQDGTIRNGSSVQERYVDLRVDTMTSVIIPVDISAYYVTWTWNQSPSTSLGSGIRPPANLAPLPLQRHHRPPSPAPPGDCQLVFKSEHDEEFVHIDLPALWERYTVTRLKPETNYSFCLIYSRDEVAMYKYCTNVRTEKAYLHLGVSLNYSLIALLAVSISLICALCMARCVNKRLHIWQEEKYRGRMQESMSAQGFLSSFESLTSGSLAAVAATAVTYENHGALDNVSQYGEQETRLDETIQSTSNVDHLEVDLARTRPRKNVNKKCHMSTVMVETHAHADADA